MLFRTVVFASSLLTACASSGDRDETPSAACEAVGSSFCSTLYGCYSATEIADLQLPPTEAECVVQQNVGCTLAAPAPGFCKGKPQLDADAAIECAAELDALTCEALDQPSSSETCRSQLCAP